MSNMYKYIKSLTMISINLVFPWHYKLKGILKYCIPYHFSQELHTKLHKKSQNEERGEKMSN
jgi:hypothetical protein